MADPVEWEIIGDNYTAGIFAGEGVGLFKRPGFEGDGQALIRGKYNRASPAVGDGTVSSLRVPAGYKVTLYERADFGGKSKSFTTDTAYVGDDFSRRTFAITVEKA